MKPLTSAVSVIGAALLGAAAVFSDEPSASDRLNQRQEERGSAASFDKRLPPVIPGEEVKDGNKTIKVWSTAGGVSAGNPPEAPGAPDPFRRNEDRLNVSESGLDIIVDSREDRGGRDYPDRYRESNREGFDR